MEEMKQRFSKDNEPPKGEGTTMIRFQMPNGTKIDRRFYSSDTIQVNYLFN